jgi:glycosyltransferase involved in cell wall biosynthesis
MSATSDISVIIPYYNREKYIDEAVQSVLAQTLKPLEIIIVNDCSRESSRRYLDRYADVCTIVDLTVNVGLAGSRNAGIRVARGQFIALLDDDDIWLPEKLKRQRMYMEEHPACSAVHSQVWAFFPDNHEQIWSLFRPGPMLLAHALSDQYWVVPSTLMIRTSVIRALGGFDVRFRECEDRDFMIRCCAAGYGIEGISEPLIRLRRNSDDSLSERRWRMFRVHVRIIWIHKSLFYRAYGLRGPMNFLLRTLFIASCKTKYVDGPVRFLLRVIKVKWQVRANYRDPVLSKGQSQPITVQTPGLQLPSAGDH